MACTFRGAGSPLGTASLQVVKEPPKMVVWRMMGSSLETDAAFRGCTVGELLQDCDSVSVMTVQEKCDEKGLGAASGHGKVTCRQFGTAPSRKAREGAHPQLFRVSVENKSALKWPTRPGEGHQFGQQNQLARLPPAVSGIRNSGNSLTSLTVSRLTVMTWPIRRKIYC